MYVQIHGFEFSKLFFIFSSLYFLRLCSLVRKAQRWETNDVIKKQEQPRFGSADCCQRANLKSSEIRTFKSVVFHLK